MNERINNNEEENCTVNHRFLQTVSAGPSEQLSRGTHGGGDAHTCPSVGAAAAVLSPRRTRTRPAWHPSRTPSFFCFSVVVLLSHAKRSSGVSSAVGWRTRGPDKMAAYGQDMGGNQIFVSVRRGTEYPPLVVDVRCGARARRRKKQNTTRGNARAARPAAVLAPRGGGGG